MALSFPLGIGTVANNLDVREVSFALEPMQEFSGLGSGDLQSADLAPARWRAELDLVVRTHAAAQQMMARINALQARGATFTLFHPSIYYPQADPDGSIFASATPQVDSRDDAWTLSIKGLPAAYVLTVGDMFSIRYDSADRYYLGQFTEGGTADGSGDLASLTCVPALPAGVAADDNITLIKPRGVFKVEPGSVGVSSAGPLHQSIRFNAIQTYEAT